MANSRKPGERAVENIARRAAAHVRDEPDAARIAFASWVVQKLPVAGDGEYLSFGGSKTPAGYLVELVRRRREVGAG